MKDYYSLFAELSLQQCTKEDYADKTKVKAGNAAHKKLKQLQDEMKQIDSTEVLLALLSHEDDRVKQRGFFLLANGYSCSSVSFRFEENNKKIRRSDNCIFRKDGVAGLRQDMSIGITLKQTLMSM